MKWRSHDTINLKKKKKENPTGNIYVWKDRKLNVFVVFCSYFSPKWLYEIFELFYFGHICNSNMIAFG